ncbi:unnamed protein product [Triticum turgidum subsp. durum]|uniref:Aminotransferase-like plant mobile domain-containing protein n=1 Tax=Triticum turgidum subsp. durum TaxID=4567 RepID=A0A9R0R8M1_TRITD|nr:unnamed protein product [Triticum turgidum subsp. durum]
MRSNPATPANPSGSRKRGHYNSANKSRRKGDTAYRCSPHLIPPIMKLLSDRQRGFVRKIGFGSLLSMEDFEMDRALTLWLIDRFSCDTEALEFQGGVSVPVRPLVESVLGIPAGPIQVVAGLHVGDALRTRYRCLKGKNAEKLAEEMRGMTEEEPFCMAFMMVILAIYLAPNTTKLVNRYLFGAAQQVGSLRQMDWCGFVADYLFRGIRKFKESEAPFVFVKGCVHILNVIYVDLVKHAAFEVPNGFPRLGVVTTEHNKLVASHPFGSLLVRRLEESVYAPVLNNMGNGSIVKGGTCADSDTNTDALANQFAITVTHQNNPQPIAAYPGTARTTPDITSLASVEHVALETSARSADCGEDAACARSHFGKEQGFAEGRSDTREGEGGAAQQWANATPDGRYALNLPSGGVIFSPSVQGKFTMKYLGFREPWGQQASTKMGNLLPLLGTIVFWRECPLQEYFGRFQNFFGTPLKIPDAFQNFSGLMVYSGAIFGFPSETFSVSSKLFR